MARLAATLIAHRSAIKLDFSISHDKNSVLILCIIVAAVFFFGQGSSSHDFGWQSSQSVDLAGWQTKMASIEIWVP